MAANDWLARSPVTAENRQKKDEHSGNRQTALMIPFRHRLEMGVMLKPDGLTLETMLFAGPDGPVPVSFGFHPYRSYGCAQG